MKDITGKAFGKLVVLGEAPKREGSKARRWLVRCACGKEYDVGDSHLGPRNFSTGCKDCSEGGRAKGANTIHGQTGTRLYKIWEGIKVRCTNTKRDTAKDYIGRGIIMHPEWVESFEAFRDYIGPAPSDKHSVDRINNDGNYEPGNVRWATNKEQCRNRRTNRTINTPDGPMLVIEASEKYGIKFGNIMNRIRRGWPEERWLEKERAT